MHPDVEGYGVVTEGEIYHPSAFTDPATQFKYAGDPEKQAEYQELKTPQEINGVPSNPTEVTAEQSNAELGTSRVHPDVPNVAVEFTAQPSVVVTKVEDGEVVEVTPTTNVVGVEPNGEPLQVSNPSAADPANLLSDKSAAEIADAIKAKQLEDQQSLNERADEQAVVESDEKGFIPSSENPDEGKTATDVKFE